MTCAYALLFAVGCALLQAAGAGQAVSAGLNPRIGPANPSKYRQIVEASKFRNPYVGVGADDITVTATGLVPGRQNISVDTLRALLLRLPVRAWPYGRVVWASDSGVRRGDLSETDAIRANHEAVERVLRELDILVEWLPSA